MPKLDIPFGPFAGAFGEEVTITKPDGTSFQATVLVNRMPVTFQGDVRHYEIEIVAEKSLGIQQDDVVTLEEGDKRVSEIPRSGNIPTWIRALVS